MTVTLFVLICSLVKTVIGEQEGFIVGGDVVDTIKEFPHAAFLTLSGSEGTFICGSSILNQIILITAAHCLDDINEITASVGSLNREQGIHYKVKTFEQHEKFDPVIVHHDIGLCKLKRPLKLGNPVKRVVLMKHPPRARTADLAAWGAVEENDYGDSIMLKHTRQMLWSHDKCQQILHKAPKGTICGGQSHARGDFASKGDSGSGLLIHKNIIVGLVSYKNPYVSHSLVIYTDVPYYYNWIVRTAKKLKCS